MKFFSITLSVFFLFISINTSANFEPPKNYYHPILKITPSTDWSNKDITQSKQMAKKGKKDSYAAYGCQLYDLGNYSDAYEWLKKAMIYANSSESKNLINKYSSNYLAVTSRLAKIYAYGVGADKNLIKSKKIIKEILPIVYAKLKNTDYLMLRAKRDQNFRQYNYFLKIIAEYRMLIDELHKINQKQISLSRL